MGWGFVKDVGFCFGIGVRERGRGDDVVGFVIYFFGMCFCVWLRG